MDSRVDSGVGNSVDSRGGDMGNSADSRGSNVDGRSGSVDSTVADGANTRDNTVAVVDSGDDSTAGQTVGNLPNGVGVGISLSPGGGHKKNLRMVMVNKRICLLKTSLLREYVIRKESCLQKRRPS